MLRVNQTWSDNIALGREPIDYIIIETDLGFRGYGARDLSFLSLSTPNLYDGTYLFDGTITYGGSAFEILSYDARVISFGSLSRNLKPRVNDLFTAFQNKEQASMDIVLNNADFYFTKLLAKEPILGKTLTFYSGFAGTDQTTHIKLFAGKITSYEDRAGQFTITALENYTELEGTYYLEKADSFTNYLNANDALPIVYGDLTDGSYGIWKAPCIDTVSFVYCFAGHEVLSVANGNVVKVYVDDVLQSSGYTFDESNASYNNYATITFSGDQGNATVSVSGKGKNSGATLIENGSDILDDFLTNFIGWSGSMESTSKSKSSQIFDDQSYKMACVITQDEDIWSILQKIASSFLADLYLNGSGNLVFSIQTFEAQTGFNDVVRKKDLVVSTQKHDWNNLINQVYCYFRYNYLYSDWAWYSSGESTKNQLSQNVYGERLPSDPYPFYCVRDASTIVSLQTKLVDRFKDPVWIVDITNNSGALFHVETGDILMATLEGIYDDSGGQLINQFWKVIQVQHDFDGHFSTLELINTDSFLLWAEQYTGSYRMPSPLGSGPLLYDGSIKFGGNRDSSVY